MPLHFGADELRLRRGRAIAMMAARGLDGMLLFRQESMYWLTGYDSFGYVFFQCLYLGADGRMMLLTRAPDLRQARHTSVIEDIRVWADREGADPAVELGDILKGFRCQGRTLGAEFAAYGLPHAEGRRLEAAFAGFCKLVDASDLVNRLRVVKSETELAFARQAAALADLALEAAERTIAPGAFEGDVLAAMHGAIYGAGGDGPANPFIVGSGPGALLCRYFTGRRHLDPLDQITLEFAGVWRHYHAALMRTILVGRVSPRQKEMHGVALDAMAACLEALKPGRPIGEAFDAYARVCDRAGMQAHRLNATGYSLGATFAPNWMDWPMLHAGNPVVARPGMVFFLHMILMDSDAGLAMCPGQTVVVTEKGAETLSKRSLDLVVR